MANSVDNKTEADWQAEYDARTLAEANVIARDPDRFKKAQTAASRLAEEESERAKAMRTVASRKSGTSRPRTTPGPMAVPRKTAAGASSSQGTATFDLPRIGPKK